MGAEPGRSRVEFLRFADGTILSHVNAAAALQTEVLVVSCCHALDMTTAVEPTPGRLSVIFSWIHGFMAERGRARAKARHAHRASKSEVKICRIKRFMNLASRS